MYPMSSPRLVAASWRWSVALVAAAAAVVSFALLSSVNAAPSGFSSFTPSSATQPALSPALSALAATSPDKGVEVLVQFEAGINETAARETVRVAGGDAGRALPLINGLHVRMTAAEAQRLSIDTRVKAVSPNAAVESEAALDPSKLATSYVHSLRAEKMWASGYTGEGVGVAVVDTGIQGDLPDFRKSESDGTSRVVASAVVNPGAENAGDSFGHGTHIAGLIAGNGANRPSGDPLQGKYVGVAPDANLISVKVSDETGAATVMDVIDGLQWIIDNKATYNIRIANLSLKSSVAESYKTDPLDAAVEAAWFNGIVIVAAAGNLGGNADAVNYAPANDPYVITVGGVDDKGTKGIEDDQLAPWSSRGTTQDGFEKPEIIAPGAKLASTMAPNAKYKELCPSCIVDGDYFRVGGTSMAAAVVSGEIAQLLEAKPGLTPNQVKAVVYKRSRPVTSDVTSTGVLVAADGTPLPTTTTVTTTVTGAEAASDKAINNPTPLPMNVGLTPNELINPVTGNIDYSRASWSRASWSDATDVLRASWSRASWSRASWSRASWSASQFSCSDFERASWSRASWSSEDIAAAQADCVAIDPTRASWSRASWSRASWSRASWSTFFG
jgi:serine protease AprX